jgi:hypothetical protein
MFVVQFRAYRFRAEAEFLSLTVATAVYNNRS